MINLLEVNACASIALECLTSADKSKAQEILTSLEAKSADKREILSKLEAKANEIGSDNCWNRYESADEAYGYAEELSNLLQDFTNGDTDYEEIEWQLQDLANKSEREAYYRLERAQW